MGFVVFLVSSIQSFAWSIGTFTRFKQWIKLVFECFEPFYRFLAIFTSLSRILRNLTRLSGIASWIDRIELETGAFVVKSYRYSPHPIGSPQLIFASLSNRLKVVWPYPLFDSELVTMCQPVLQILWATLVSERVWGRSNFFEYHLSTLSLVNHFGLLLTLTDQNVQVISNPMLTFCSKIAHYLRKLSWSLFESQHFAFCIHYWYQVYF